MSLIYIFLVLKLRGQLVVDEVAVGRGQSMSERDSRKQWSDYLDVLGSYLHCHPGGRIWSWTGMAYEGGSEACDEVDGVVATL